MDKDKRKRSGVSGESASGETASGESATGAVLNHTSTSSKENRGGEGHQRATIGPAAGRKAAKFEAKN